MFIPFYDNNYFYYLPFLPPNCDKPPTIYSILNSIVNGEKDEEDYTPISQLANEGRSTIFNFNYPLSTHVTKQDFECMILNHYMMRRIGFETVTAFRLQLNVRLNSIMPLINKMFDAIENWNIFNDGEKISRYGTDNRSVDVTSDSENSINNISNTTSDRRYSDTPQNELSNVRDGKYITEYNYDANSDSSSTAGTSSNTTNTTDDNTYAETIEKTETNKIEILKEFQNEINSIYEIIFNKLDDLFYGII